jgi:kynurenine formamidase
MWSALQLRGETAMVRTIVDLSVELAHHMPRYPSPYLPEVTIEPAATHEVEKRSAQIVRFGTHVSTHLDAPLHSVPGGRSISDIPPEWLVGSARRIDLTQGGFNRSNPISQSDLAAAGLQANDEDVRLILDTGWSVRTWGTAEYFTGGAFITRDAAEYFRGLPNLRILGMDFPNVDAPHETVMGTVAPNHRILLGNEIILLENLVNLERLPHRFELFIGVPRLVGGDGCPCRALAIFDDAKTAYAA